MADSFVFDVTVENFQRDVAERSMTVPVLLDFWAEWCGPCRTLGPILEQIVAEFGGSFLLGKVDSDQQRELAAAFQVQGIPFCVLVDGGRPVDAFQGALRETEVRRFLQRNAIGPAQKAEAEEKPVEPDSPEGRLQRAIGAAWEGDAGAVRAALHGFPEEDERNDRAQRLLTAVEWLEAPLDPQKGGAEGLLARGRQLLLEGSAEAAMESVLEAVAADKTFRGGLPRKAMLLCFLLVGEQEEILDPYRRRLATLLY